MEQHVKPTQSDWPPTHRRVEEVSVKDWFITLLILSIPLIGQVMIFVWAFSGGAPASKSNYFKALLLWSLIALVVGLFISTTLLSLF